MAGIMANSVSQTMASGATATDKTVSNYVVGEMITLTTSPTGTNYSWAQSRPAASGSTAGLSSATASGPTFTPNASGTYLVTADVDGTDYVIRIGVNAVGVASGVDIMRLQPIADTSCPTPPTNYLSLFNSTTQGGLAFKDSGAVMHALGIRKKSVQITTTTLAASATSQAINVGTALPTNAQVLASQITLAEVFAGGGAGSATIKLGGTDVDAICTGHNVFTGQALVAATPTPAGIHTAGSFSAEQLVATVTSDVDVDTLTTGDATITVWYFVLA